MTTLTPLTFTVLSEPKTTLQANSERVAYEALRVMNSGEPPKRTTFSFEVFCLVVDRATSKLSQSLAYRFTGSIPLSVTGQLPQPFDSDPAPT